MFSTDTLLSPTLWLALINLKIQTFLAKPVDLETRSTVLNLPLDLAFPAVVFLAMIYFLSWQGSLNSAFVIVCFD
jgi:hypothetical protein